MKLKYQNSQGKGAKEKSQEEMQKEALEQWERITEGNLLHKKEIRMGVSQGTSTSGQQGPQEEDIEDELIELQNHLQYQKR